MTMLSSFSAYRALTPQNRRTVADMHSFRDRQIRKLVDHAYRNVPFYTRLFDSAAINPRDIRGAADLERIPVTTRDDIQNASLADRLARGTDPAKLIARKTTGSSGQCLVVMRTWREEQTLNLFRWRALRSYGLKRKDIIGVPRIVNVIDPRDNQIPRRIADKLRFYRKIVIDLLAPDPIGDLHAKHPEVIMSWPTVLAAMAPAWAERKTSSSRAPKFIIAGGETLTEIRRERISKGFGARVFDMVGAHEFSLVAWECAKSGEYHLSDETMFTEVLDDGRRVEPGERGELVGTNLHSFAMPFIRYKLGDLVTQGTTPCACGSPFSSIRGISGRVVDLIELPGGRKIHPQDVSRESFIAAPVIRTLQVVQHALDRIELHIIPYREPTPEEIAAIYKSMEKWIGPGVSFDVVIVSEIATPPETKFRVYRSTMTDAS